MKLARAIRKAKRVYLVGNGGSYANALHICNDLVAVGVKACVLDCSTFSASANDFGYESAFSRWLEVMADPGDLLIALSGSGRSPNILKAIQSAKDKGAKTYAIVGEYNTDCPAAVLADQCLRWGRDMQDAEEKQLILGHKVMRWLKNS